MRALVALLTVWGSARIARGRLLASRRSGSRRGLQGNVAQEEKWDPALRDAITNRYLTMTRQALAQGATFILWPESSTPFYFEQDITRGSAVRRLAAKRTRRSSSAAIRSSRCSPRLAGGTPQTGTTTRRSS